MNWQQDPLKSEQQITWNTAPAGNAMAGMKRATETSPIPRYLLWQLVWGCCVGIVVAAGALATNVFGITTLALASPEPVVAIALIFGGSISTFATTVFATGVALLAFESHPDD